MQYLKRLKFNVFAEDELCAKYAIPNSAVPVLPRETRCGVDRIFWGPQQKTLTITGWAVDADAGCPAGGVAVLVDGLAYPAWYGERNRQAELLLGDERTACGFLCEIPASRLSGGEHAILLKVQTYDHKAVFRASGERKFIAKQLP